MPHLTDLTIRNFKGLQEVELKEFAHINLLVGANNCGKTRTLEAIAQHCTKHTIPVYSLDIPGDPALLDLLNDHIVADLSSLLRRATAPSIVTPHLVDGVLYMKCEGGRLPASSMGRGINRMVQLALAIVQSANGVLLIEDLEWAIHIDNYGAFTWLATWAKQNGVQIFATTHSLDAIDAMLDATDEDTDLVLFRMESLKTKTRIVRHHRDRLRRLRENMDQEVR